MDNLQTPLKRKSATDTADSDILSFMPLGSGREVGRSCHILRIRGKTIMLDCGVHPAYSGTDSLPYLDQVNIEDIDLVLISHFHLDHAAGLPYLLKDPRFRGRVFMTYPTKSIYKLILQDFVKVTSASVKDVLYTEADLLASMDKIEVINFHQVILHKGIRFWTYHAGHVLGAVMYMIEVGDTRILYTGDYSRTEDRHLMAAELPETSAQILIVEATHGTQHHHPPAIRERLFTDFIHKIVQGGGKCLVPQFALGRAQELLLILDEHWEKHPELQDIPIYYASSLANRCLRVYQSYTSMMNKSIIERSAMRNPFNFKYVIALKSMSHFDSTQPAVVMASPGMLQNGLSRQLLEEWCGDPKNGVMIAGYCVEGTLAYLLQSSRPSWITASHGESLPMELQVASVPFTAHSDCRETCDFVQYLNSSHIILVHGNSKEMGSLEKKLKELTSDRHAQVFSPRNCQEIRIEFTTQKLVRTVGDVFGEGSNITSTGTNTNQEEQTQTQDGTPVLSEDTIVQLDAGTTSTSNTASKDTDDMKDDGDITGTTNTTTTTSTDSTNIDISTPGASGASTSTSTSTTGGVQPGYVVNALLVHKDFQTQIILPKEARRFTKLQATTVTQRLTIPCTQSFDTIRLVLSQMFTIVDQHSIYTITHPNEPQQPRLFTYPSVIVMNCVTVTYIDASILPQLTTAKVENKPGALDAAFYMTNKPRSKILRVIWKAGLTSDLIADSVITLLTSVEGNPGAALAISDGSKGCLHEQHAHGHGHGHDHHHGCSGTGTIHTNTGSKTLNTTDIICNNLTEYDLESFIVSLSTALTVSSLGSTRFQRSLPSSEPTVDLTTEVPLQETKEYIEEVSARLELEEVYKDYVFSESEAESANEEDGDDDEDQEETESQNKHKDTNKDAIGTSTTTNTDVYPMNNSNTVSTSSSSSSEEKEMAMQDDPNVVPVSGTTTTTSTAATAEVEVVKEPCDLGEEFTLVHTPDHTCCHVYIKCLGIECLLFLKDLYIHILDSNHLSSVQCTHITDRIQQLTKAYLLATTKCEMKQWLFTHPCPETHKYILNVYGEDVLLTTQANALANNNTLLPGTKRGLGGRGSSGKSGLHGSGSGSGSSTTGTGGDSDSGSDTDDEETSGDSDSETEHDGQYHPQDQYGGVGTTKHPSTGTPMGGNSSSSGNQHEPIPPSSKEEVRTKLHF